MVECQLCKLEVEGSSPFRSIVATLRNTTRSVVFCRENKRFLNSGAFPICTLIFATRSSRLQCFVPRLLTFPLTVLIWYIGGPGASFAVIAIRDVVDTVEG